MQRSNDDDDDQTQTYYGRRHLCLIWKRMDSFLFLSFFLLFDVYSLVRITIPKTFRMKPRNPPGLRTWRSSLHKDLREEGAAEAIERYNQMLASFINIVESVPSRSAGSVTFWWVSSLLPWSDGGAPILGLVFAIVLTRKQLALHFTIFAMKTRMGMPRSPVL